MKWGHDARVDAGGYGCSRWLATRLQACSMMSPVAAEAGEPVDQGVFAEPGELALGVVAMALWAWAMASSRVSSPRRTAMAWA